MKPDHERQASGNTSPVVEIPGEDATDVGLVGIGGIEVDLLGPLFVRMEAEVVAVVEVDLDALFWDERAAEVAATAASSPKITYRISG